jgi:uncharacterized protein YdcH (DUF465 family)
MSHTKHDLHDEFPEHVAAMHAMREKNPHFAHLIEQYNEVNLAIYRVEAQIEATDDFHLEDMKKQRLRLLDQITAALPHK